MDECKIASQEHAGPGGKRVVVTSVSGRIDARSLGLLEAHVMGHVKEGIRHVVIDCHRLTYLNSTSAGLMIKLHDAIQRDGGSFQLARVPPPIHSLLDVLGLTDYLREAESVPEAIARA